MSGAADAEPDRPAARTHRELPDHTRSLLNELRPEEVETLKEISRLGPEGTRQLLDTIRLAQSIMTVSKFVKWCIITFFGFFIGAVMFAETIMKVLRWLFPREAGL